MINQYDSTEKRLSNIDAFAENVKGLSKGNNSRAIAGISQALPGAALRLAGIYKIENFGLETPAEQGTN